MSKKNINRRKFIENTALAGAVGLVAGGMLSSCSKKKSYEELGLPPLANHAPDGKELKVGLIGCGNRGTGALMNFLSSGPHLKVGALADVFPEKIEAVRARLRKYNMDITDDRCFTGLDAYKRVMETDVDVVLLVTPPYFRPEMFKAAVEARKHVFMEKPVAVDPVGIRQIIATARTAKTLGLNVVTGTQRRHQKSYIKTYEQVANGAIGELLAAKAFWNQEHVWFRRRQPEWNDMEYMIRNWNNFIWLSGDHFLDTHIHNIDVVNWFMGTHPEWALGYGGRARRVTGNQYDFFSVDFSYGKGKFSHSMSRQIDNCTNGVGEMIVGTKGYTNCIDKIFDHDGNVIWEYEYPKDKDGNPVKKGRITEYVQEHIHLITAIRTNIYVNTAETTAISNLTAIMGRESAYTGKRITWDEIMSSDLKLGPEKVVMGDVDDMVKFETVPLPGTPIKV
ncbi:MAG: Gfo/Idh/MocA family oxidoreductase [Chlorobi bacterium]|nr:Gfo/Idh/MocA family oxidoreductase [Chlorobiota bacterium]